jgi:hypothetical protein
MYATLKNYELHDTKYHTKEYFEQENKTEYKEPIKKRHKIMIDTPELRRKRRGGMGIDSLKKETRENFTPNPDLVKKARKEENRKEQCRPYDPSRPYRYMFDPHYNKYPYGPDYKVVDGEDDGKRYLNVPAYSYPDYGSTTRVLYCDDPPKLWEFCDYDYR